MSIDVVLNYSPIDTVIDSGLVNITLGDVGPMGPTGPTGPSGSTVPREQGITSPTSVYPNTADTDLIDILNLANAVGIYNPGGTFEEGQKLMFRIQDTGTAQEITWDSAYLSGGIPLPAVTVPSKWMHLGFMYNSFASGWMLIAFLTN